MAVPTVDAFRSWLTQRRELETLAHIAGSMGVSVYTLQRWLTGERRPSRMALVLGGLLMGGGTGEWPLSGDLDR